MNTLCPEIKSIRKVINRYILLTQVGLVCALFLVSSAVQGQDIAWPQFRGPDSNPVGAHARLAERWSKTENVEWSQEIPGRGWSSPIVTGGKVYVTTVTTEGKSKPPQIGTEYSNEYVAELQKQGLPMEQVMERVTERDIELPQRGDAPLLALLPEPEERQGGMAEGVLHGATAGRASPQEQLCLGESGDRWEVRLRVCGESGVMGV